MMPTELLYHRDPLLLSFSSTVVGHGRFGDKDSVVLASTAFYPEAGGQMADRGALGGRAIVDVQIDDAGLVHHVVDGPLPAVGDTVEGSIDRARRKLFMALHTGQHMLSRALVDVAKADTVSARLGESVCTVDVDVPALSDRQIAESEALVNAVVDDDVAVRAWFPDPDELRGLPLRRQPKVAENVRVVEVQGFDTSPCGGTHCTRTAQVGLIRVVATERYKGKMRVTFNAGPRARGELLDEAKALRALAAQFSCGVFDVPASLDKVRRDLASAREAQKRLTERVSISVAEELFASSTAGKIVASLEDKELMRAVAKHLATKDGAVALLCAPDDDGTALLAVRGPAATFDCGAFVKTVCQAHGGKGGGKAERAEGRVPTALDWKAVASA